MKKNLSSRVLQALGPLILLVLSLLLAGCPSTETPTSKGSLRIVVDGLPEGTEADVSVSGPGGYSQSVTASTTLDGLAPGAYMVTAATVVSGSDTYMPDPPSQSVTVEAARTATASVGYSRQERELPSGTGSLSVTIAGLPEGVAAAVTVTAPGGQTRTLTASSVLDGIEPGDYTISAAEVSSVYTYTPDPATQTVSVGPDATASATITYEPTTGALAFVIEGLPNGVPADIAVSGPEGFSQSVNETIVLEDLEPGTYDYDAPEVVTAEDVTDGAVGYTYVSQLPAWDGVIEAGETIRLELGYQAATGSILIVVRGLPTGAEAQVTLSQGGVFSQDFTTTGALNNLPSGTYTFAATPVEVDGYTYGPIAPSSGERELALGETLIVEVAYRATKGKLMLRSEGLPDGTAIEVGVSGPDGSDMQSSFTVSTPETLTLDPGYYDVYSPDQVVVIGSDDYRLLNAFHYVSVAAGQETTVTFRYAVVGELDVNISGLPDDVEADVVVTGPNGFSDHLTSSGFYSHIPIGAYTIEAQNVFPPYYPEPASQTATVLPDQRTTVEVRYRPQVTKPALGDRQHE